MRQHYLRATLISEAIESVSLKGTPCVKFILRDEDEDSHGSAFSCWCFIAKLWPAILACRKGDALSVVGRPRREGGTAYDDAQGQGTDLIVQRVLSVYRQPAHI